MAMDESTTAQAPLEAAEVVAKLHWLAAHWRSESEGEGGASAAEWTAVVERAAELIVEGGGGWEPPSI